VRRACSCFDGIDIDWEHPGAPGHLGNHYSSADMANYTLLLKEFRTELDALGGGHRYLTAAVPAGQDKISHIQTGQIAQHLGYANVMTCAGSRLPAVRERRRCLLLQGTLRHRRQPG
jgi:chitinase